jgi:Zn-dependent peptidase ImmA (M78 family)
MMSYIDNSRAKEIEAIASDVLSDIYHGEISLPIDLGSIAKAYNIQLKTAQFEDRGIAGEYDRPSETIVVSGEDDFSRQTFTIAHEMGHHFLHREKSSDTLYRLDVLDLNRQNVGE